MVSTVSMVRAALAAAMWGAASGAVAVQSRFNLAPPKTPIAEEIYSLHNLMLIICTAIFVAVFSVMFYSIWKHRRSKGAVAANWHENTTVEIIWTVIPFIIVIVMALPATRTVVAMKDTSNADLTVKVTGYQWKWGYDYLRGEGEGISFLSQLATPAAQIEGREPKTSTYLLEVDNPLVVPVGKKVRLLITANDVIHAWSVQALGIKQDAIPGFIKDAWFKAETPGTFRGQCSELCGKDHGFMPIVVEVVSQEKYAAWVADQNKKMAAAADDPNKQWTLPELVVRGEKVFSANCAACHQANGKGVAGAFPALAGSAFVNGPADAVVKTLLEGRKGTAMASFKQLSDTELAAVADYVRNSWGNSNAEPVLPAQVKAAR